MSVSISAAKLKAAMAAFSSLVPGNDEYHLFTLGDEAMRLFALTQYGGVVMDVQSGSGLLPPSVTATMRAVTLSDTKMANWMASVAKTENIQIAIADDQTSVTVIAGKAKAVFANQGRYDDDEGKKFLQESVQRVLAPMPSNAIVLGTGFAQAFAIAAAGASTDPLRPHLGGVRVYGDGSTMIVEATDGFRIHHVEIPTDGKISALILPASLLPLLKASSSVTLGAIKGDDGQELLAVNATVALCNVRMLIRTLQSKNYPDLGSILNLESIKDYQESGTVHEAQTRRLKEAIASVATTQTNIIEVWGSNNKSIIYGGGELGEVATFVGSLPHDGFLTAYNIKFFRSAVEGLTATSVRMVIGSEDSQHAMKFVSPLGDWGTLAVMLMPLSVSGVEEHAAITQIVCDLQKQSADEADSASPSVDARQKESLHVEANGGNE